ncbi:hypothetical protein TWF506_010021 [Arthrobotrys conoides]|uniref:Uncharacterized protein n=1 Tax=Arthrobotrys conoides TaxID=74498 RepID=A0AAN8NJL0_9PEZI
MTQQAETIREYIYARNPTAFEFTRALVLGPPVFTSKVDLQTQKIWPNHFRRVFGNPLELAEILRELVDGGYLDLRKLVIDLSDIGSSPYLRDIQELLLLSLKAHALAKHPGGFSTQVYGGTIRRLIRFFHLDSIVKLEMGVEGNHKDNRSLRIKLGDKRASWIGSEMLGLASLLSELPNLRVFSWRDPSDMHILRSPIDPISLSLQFSKFSEERKKLQAVFLGMRKLVELKFYSYFFDPSFFVIPPENVRKLTIGIEMSDSWWRQFASYEMTSLTEVEIDISHWSMSPNLLSPDFRIGDVAITGLKKFSILHSDLFLPDDLEECLARRNKGYLPQYLRDSARKRAHKILDESSPKLAGHASYVSDALESEYVAKIVASPKSENYRREFVQAYASAFMSSFTGDIDRSSWISARQDANILLVKTSKYFETVLLRIMQEVEDLYRAKFAQGLQFNDQSEQEFRDQCWEKLNNLGETDKYEYGDASALLNTRMVRELAIVSERELKSLVHQLRDVKKLGKQRDKINNTAIEKMTTAIMNDSEQDIDGIMTEWVRGRVQLLEYVFL